MTLQSVVGLCSISWVFWAAGCGKLCTKSCVAAAVLEPSALLHQEACGSLFLLFPHTCACLSFGQRYAGCTQEAVTQKLQLACPQKTCKLWSQAAGPELLHICCRSAPPELTPSPGARLSPKCTGAPSPRTRGMSWKLLQQQLVPLCV